MAWNAVKNINHTIRSNGVSQAEGFWNTIMGSQYWYLKGVFMIHTTGTLYVDSSNSKSYRLQCSIYVQHCYTNTGGYWTSNNGSGIHIYFDGDEIESKAANMPISCWNNSTYTDVKVVDIDKTFTVNKAGYLDVEVDVWQNGASRGQGSTNHNVPSSILKSNGTYDGVVGFNGTYSNFIDYKVPDPYKKPTVSFSGASISIYDVNRTINVASNTSGDTNATNVNVTINGVSHNTSLGNNGGNYSFKPSDNNVGQASSYTVKVTRTHSKDSSLSASASKTLYTYRIPTITNFSLDPSTISGNGGGNIKWSCNNRRWNDDNLEKQFKTYIYNSKKAIWNEASTHAPTDVNVGNIAQSQAMSKAWIDSILTNSDKCADSVSFKVNVRRKNESSGQTADATATTLTINYKPTKTIGSNSISYYDCNSDNKTPNTSKVLTEGNEYYIDEHPYVYVKWIYPSDLDGGVISGYLFKVYTDSSCTTTKYTKDITSTNLTEGIPLNIRTDLKRGSINYVGITPYYKDPNGTKRYGPESIKKFIKPIGKLSKPVIDGPINRTSWHNNQFRILVTSPLDDDFDEEGVTEANYRYKAIEVKINDATYTFANNEIIFSTATVSYMKPLVINPSLLSNFPDIDSYTIQIRFQKNYFSNVWSLWSDPVTVNNYAINEITKTEGIEKEKKVLLIHYNTVQQYSVRLYDVYFINRNNLPSTNKTLPAESIIKSENYQGIYDSILQIQNKVNGYANFDSNRLNVRFNKTIDNFNGNNKPIRGEIITQDKISNNPIGRNYMNICIECMNKLSN